MKNGKLSAEECTMKLKDNDINNNFSYSNWFIYSNDEFNYAFYRNYGYIKAWVTPKSLLLKYYNTFKAKCLHDNNFPVYIMNEQANQYELKLK